MNNMYPQYQPIQPVEYQSTMVPVQVPFELMANVSNKMQDRYDKANLAYNTKMDEWLNQSYIDEASRNLFIEEQSKKFDNIYNKYKGDLARGYNDVINFLGQASKHPYLNLNKKQQEAFEKFEKYQQAYGPDLIIAKAPDKELFKINGDGKIQWKKPSDLEPELYKAPDYAGNAWKLVGELRGSGGEGKLDAESYKTLGLLASNNWEAIDDKMIKELAYNPIVIEAFKKMSVNWDKDNRPDYNKWGLDEAGGDRNSEIVNKKMGEFIESVLRQKKYYKSSKSYMQDPTRPDASSQTIADALQGLAGVIQTTQTPVGPDGTPIKQVKNDEIPSALSIFNKDFRKLMYLSNPGMALALKEVDKNIKTQMGKEIKNLDGVGVNDKFVANTLGINVEDVSFTDYLKTFTNMMDNGYDVKGYLNKKLQEQVAQENKFNKANLLTVPTSAVELMLARSGTQLIKKGFEIVNHYENLAQDIPLQMQLKSYFGENTFNQITNNGKDITGMGLLYNKFVKDNTDRTINNPGIAITDPDHIDDIAVSLFGKTGKNKGDRIIEFSDKQPLNLQRSIQGGGSVQQLNPDGTITNVEASDLVITEPVIIDQIFPTNTVHSPISGITGVEGSPAVKISTKDKSYLVSNLQLHQMFGDVTAIAGDMNSYTGFTNTKGSGGRDINIPKIRGVGRIPQTDKNGKIVKISAPVNLITRYNHGTGSYELYGIPETIKPSDIVKFIDEKKVPPIFSGNAVDVNTAKNELIKLNKK